MIRKYRRGSRIEFINAENDLMGILKYCELQ